MAAVGCLLGTQNAVYDLFVESTQSDTGPYFLSFSFSMNAESIELVTIEMKFQFRLLIGDRVGGI